MVDASPAPRFVLHPQLAQDTLHVTALPLCELRLMNDARFPWLVLVPRVVDAVELIDLHAQVRQSLVEETDRVARALRATCGADKLNVAAIGNVVAQLHVHVVARFRDDAAWPRPVWGYGTAVPYAHAAHGALSDSLRSALRS